MAQVTIYLDDETETRMRQAARAAGMSMSAWMAMLVAERTRTEWPADVAELAGAWPDFPTADELRAPEAADTPRETL